jgi:hypothetical protein
MTRLAIRDAVRRHRGTIVLFVAVFATYETYLQLFADRTFYYDAANYWALAGTFGHGGHFSLLDFGPSIRGYSLPLYNRGLQTVASHTGMGAATIVQLSGALEAALLGVLLVPRLVGVLAPSAAVSPVRIVVFNALLFVFWRDHLGFPLSDFPSLTLVIVAMLALSYRSPAGYAGAGLALGLAWNVRQAYIVTLVLVLLLVAIRAGIRRTPLAAVYAVGLVLAGVAIVSLPQSLINHRHADSWSPTVLSGKRIVLADLLYGMQSQRVDGNVGTHYRAAAVFYDDPSTQAVLTRDNITIVRSYSQYARIVERHPTVMLAGWVRRLFNGLDVRYSTPYIHDLDGTHAWFPLLNYTLLFAAASRLLIPAFRRRLGGVSWPDALAICCACIRSIPFAMESRYMLPLQLAVYALVAFGAGTALAFRELGRRNQIALGVVYVVFLIVCFTLSASTFALRRPA